MSPLMPKITLSGWENKVKAYATKAGRDPFDRGVVRLFAKTVNRRFERYNPSDEEVYAVIEELAYCLDYKDDTGEMACGFKVNPFSNTENAARRMAMTA